MGRAIGTAIASVALAQLPADLAAIVAALAILLAVALSLSGLAVRFTVATLLGAGTASGIMGTLASVGGPPMALVFQRLRGPQLRATMAGFFLFGTITLLVGRFLVGRYGLSELQATMHFLPAILAGYWLSGRATVVLDRGYARTAVPLVSAASSVVLLVRALG